MTSQNIQLTSDLASFVEKQVENGRHYDASDVVSEALRLYESELALEDQQATAIRGMIATSRQAIAEGEYTLIDGPDETNKLFIRLTHRMI